MEWFKLRPCRLRNFRFKNHGNFRWSKWCNIKLTNEAFSEVGDKSGVPSGIVAAATSYLDGLIAGSPTATAAPSGTTWKRWEVQGCYQELANEVFAQVVEKLGVLSDVVSAATSIIDEWISGSFTGTTNSSDSSVVSDPQTTASANSSSVNLSKRDDTPSTTPNASIPTASSSNSTQEKNTRNLSLYIKFKFGLCIYTA
ncbi:unnamed protein product [Ambrosiozyma monospora]|uniref:Unnamed protein product n=1 Tax=Ambrosiozyma monospora TaxID=43982 RepID=A0ACB5SYH6_AMBMO|nr:unnamed protein product [Ambrosiozyma monospora]